MINMPPPWSVAVILILENIFPHKVDHILGGTILIPLTNGRAKVLSDVM